MSLLHIFIDLLGKDKGNKGMMKSGSKRKGEKNSKKIKSRSGDSRQR